MRIRTGPDFQIQCILYGKWQNPECVVRIAVKRLLQRTQQLPAILFISAISQISGAVKAPWPGRNIVMINARTLTQPKPYIMTIRVSTLILEIG